ncbi:DUF3168 domain-containing protein [Ktedonobacteria bacterium brp13]|nr:DUF3168 domain-containing protein [Ktedonobacteria bacterium brp13]
MALPTGAIQTAFLSRYRADVPLQGLLVGSATPTWNIFDEGGVPTNQPFPYGVVFPITSQSGTALVMGRDGVDTYIQVSVFTQAGGFAQARAIIARIYYLTHQKPLDLLLSGFSQFFLMFDNEQEQQQSDGITQQIVHRYKLFTQG